MEHIQSTSGLTTVVDLPMMIFEDNVVCIEQLKKGYINGDNTKNIAPKFFYSHQQQQHQNIEVKQSVPRKTWPISLPSHCPSTFQKLVQGIGMRKLSELNCL